MHNELPIRGLMTLRPVNAVCGRSSRYFLSPLASAVTG